MYNVHIQKQFIHILQIVMGNQFANPYPNQVNPPGAMVNAGYNVPSYAPGINNTPYMNEPTANCCDCSNSNMGVQGIYPTVYGRGPNAFPLQQVQKTVQVTRNSRMINNNSVIQGNISNNFVVSETVMMDPQILMGTVQVAPMQAPAIPIVNPFATLPTRIVQVIQKIGPINPLRGSVINRLDAPQYIPEKQAHYQGQWVDGYMQGFGRLFFDNGAYFQGQFVNGVAQTRNGLFIYPDGSYYIGGVSRSVANGQGQFNYRGGRLIYRGQFLNDQPDGRGLELYSDGSRYQGEFRFGKKQGKGQFVWRQGTVYSGQFQNGFMQGEGIHKLSNGEVYEGEFKKNKRHGRGRHTTPLGVYTGGFRKDSKEGEGQFLWVDGKVFKGNFNGGRPDGPGSITLTTGITVYGIWINGQLDQNSLTSNNLLSGSQIRRSNVRGSMASIGSIESIPNLPQTTRNINTSQVMGGPPIINLRGGILAGGFTGMVSPFVGPRGSILSVIGSGGDFRGSTIPRGSTALLRGSSLTNLAQVGPILVQNTGIQRPLLGRQLIAPPVLTPTVPIAAKMSLIGPTIGSTFIPSVLSPPPMGPFGGANRFSRVQQIQTVATKSFVPPSAILANRSVSPLPRSSRISTIIPANRYPAFPLAQPSLPGTPRALTSQFVTNPRR